jgi:hypothetical protein
MDGHRQIDGRSGRTGPTALTDASLDREIESLVAAEPSPEFLARVRARVAEEPEPRMFRASWLFAMAGAVTAVVVALIAWPAVESIPRSDVAVDPPRVAESVQPAAPTTSAPEVPAASRRSTPARAVAAATAGGRSIDIDLPDVVIAENEVKTFAWLMASVRQSRFDAVVPVAPDPDPPLEIKELPALSPVIVEPLEIEPIVQLAMLE